MSLIDLQIALDWACGFGRAECSPIQPGGPCFEPNNLHSHASYAFNSYYQQNGNSDIACYARCEFATSESMKSSSSSVFGFKEMSIWRRIGLSTVVVFDLFHSESVWLCTLPGLN
ncbi:carbohydrate-binding X8 domain superfamily protein [Striga asiatica]|uniref:Carbohydrate-binding X8 domain superfamily protein n=1 Tax=Striga asiatica TaxID=4170 RepID=A0A5A7PVB1_STRAF|nr:carbohydrate-binding X8 domain superfamily protein [Striga asiatica]